MAYGRTSTLRSGDRTGLVALAIAAVSIIAMVLAVPSLLPRPVRDAIGLGPDRLAPPPRATGTGPFRFLRTQPGRPAEPVGYDPCRRIPIRVNLDGAPKGSLQLVKQAMGIVEDDTGLRFDYQGTTDRRPQWQGETVPVILGRVRTSPVLVSWATSREVDDLAGRVAGLGGSVAVPSSGGTEWYVTGGITLDSEDFAEIDSSIGGRREELAILLHEFGHLVGLDHIKDSHELMNADNVGQLGFGPGDLLGLAKIGSIDCA